MAAIKDAWGKTREKLGGAAPIQKTRSGLTKVGRTAPLQKTKAGFSRVGGGIGWATAGTRRELGKAGGVVKGGVKKATEAPRTQVSSWIEAAREHPTIAVGIAAGVLVGVAWIAWAIYVTASNGVNAGLGVLITWPVLIGALALVAAPFVLTWVLVKRFWPDGESGPPIAGGAGGDETVED